MIHFRFHIVSIIAVFLALAIGTVMGSAFVGPTVIDRLQNRIDEVESKANEKNAENEDLNAQIGDLDRYVSETTPYAIAGTLADVSVPVVAERGVDGGTVELQAALLEQAGAKVPGVMWLEPAWKLESPEEASALRTATGLTNRSPDALRTAAAKLLGRRISAATPFTSPATTLPAPATTLPAPATTLPAPGGLDDVLLSLVAAKFVTLAPLSGGPDPAAGDFVAGGARPLVIGGAQSNVPISVLPAIAHGIVENTGLAVVGQVFVQSEQNPDRSTWIDAIANADALRNRISTVDDLDRGEGQVGATLALAELGSAAFGNYGLDRDRAVPAPIP